MTLKEADTIPTIDKEMPPAQVRFKGFCKSSVAL